MPVGFARTGPRTSVVHTRPLAGMTPDTDEYVLDTPTVRGFITAARDANVPTA